MKYTLDTLKKINERFIESHRMKESDVEMANAYVELIERTRSTTEPQSGDLIQYTDEHGNYYSAAHIEKVNGDGTVNVCEKPYIPFINANVNNDGIRCCTSGGPWCDLPVNKLVYVGKGEKHFQDWGNCGGCADGAIVFNANVSVWEYVDERNKFISENGFKFTTKDFDKYYVTFNPDKEKQIMSILRMAMHGKARWTIRHGCEHTEPRYSKDTARISLWYGLGETLLILCHQMSMTIWIFQKTPS